MTDDAPCASALLSKELMTDRHLTPDGDLQHLDLSDATSLVEIREWAFLGSTDLAGTLLIPNHGHDDPHQHLCRAWCGPRPLGRDLARGDRGKRLL